MPYIFYKITQLSSLNRMYDTVIIELIPFFTFSNSAQSTGRRDKLGPSGSGPRNQCNADKSSKETVAGTFVITATNSKTANPCGAGCAKNLRDIPTIIDPSAIFNRSSSRFYRP